METLHEKDQRRHASYGQGILAWSARGLLLFAWMATPIVSAEDKASGTSSATQRALVYLEREIQSWSQHNKCFSCHNNGDAARALYWAVRGNLLATPEALRKTTHWLSQPARWKDNGGEGPFNDHKLAAIQFAHALSGASQANLTVPAQSLVDAGELLRQFQESDGSWDTQYGSLIGSPTTYGTVLATVLTRRSLASADHDHFSRAIENADMWLLRQRPRTVLDAAALLWGLTDRRRPSSELKELRDLCHDLIQRGESRDGGWGPFVTSAPEPFDTAIVLLALRQTNRNATVNQQLQHGRAYLIRTQWSDGSWPETTRPAGAESYAQRLSTTAWATMALMATAPK